MARRQRERPWMRHERWVTLACALIVLLLVLAAIGYMAGRWEPPPPEAARVH